MRLRVAMADDLPRLLALRDDTEAWLARKGVEQFQDSRFHERARTHIRDLCDAGRFVILGDDTSDFLAVGALVPPDQDFWRDGDDLASAWYIARLMVAEHGSDHGGTLLDLVSAAAAGDGRQWLRLDCWRDNQRLHAYYRTKGFQDVRIEHAEHRRSGALFQRSVAGAVPSAWDRASRFRRMDTTELVTTVGRCIILMARLEETLQELVCAKSSGNAEARKAVSGKSGEALSEQARKAGLETWADRYKLLVKHRNTLAHSMWYRADTEQGAWDARRSEPGGIAAGNVIQSRWSDEKLAQCVEAVESAVVDATNELFDAQGMSGHPLVRVFTRADLPV